MLKTLNTILYGVSLSSAPAPATGAELTALKRVAPASMLEPVSERRAKAAIQGSGLSEAGFQAYLPRLREEALAAGVSAATIDRILPTLTFSARTVQLDRQQPGGRPGSNVTPPFAPFLARHVTPALTRQGRDRLARHAAVLAEIERRTGVDAEVIVAIWGKETGFGSYMGNFDLLNSLATLSYEGRRRELFTGEFIATLKMLERGFPRSTLQGSYAGATGQSQFLPSVYIRLAVDGDGDGRADIWRNSVDALASIANYLNKAGWKAGVPWGVQANVPAGFDRASVANSFTAPRCVRVFAAHSRWLTMAEWRALGVTPARGTAIPDTEMATLLEPDGPGTPAYLLTNNYRVILDYNCSNFYGLTVALLAQGIEG